MMNRRTGFFVILSTGWLCRGAFHEAFAHRDNKDLLPAVLKKLNEEYGREPAPPGNTTE
jgi:hypothetical protein